MREILGSYLTKVTTHASKRVWNIDSQWETVRKYAKTKGIFL